jgi:hypothetical protein
VSLLLSMRILCAISDLLLKHPAAILPAYKRRHIKHLKYVSKHLQKHVEKTLENNCKHTQHLDKTLAA